jgi:23S rRNA pseudouridine1911/1915/1917 synthase
VNDGYVYREVIQSGAAGQPLVHYLCTRYVHSSRAEWLDHIEAGRVLVDGAAGASGVLLRPGQRLEWHRPPWREPDAPLGLTVLYDAGGVLVVRKPAGLPTMPGGGYLQHTLVHQVRQLDPSASPMHRLGRWTSGAVICSRTKAVGSSIAAQFTSRSIDKRYRALASGRPSFDSVAIEVPIGPVPYAPLGTLHAASEDGRPASSSVTVISRGGETFLCDVRIATGRPHQIRIHLAAAGHPLVGDPLYVVGGRPALGGTALPGDPGYHLHAAEVGFEHPETGQRVVVRAPLPEALRACSEGRRDGADEAVGHGNT